MLKTLTKKPRERLLAFTLVDDPARLKRSSTEAILPLEGVGETSDRNYDLVKQVPALYVYRRLPTDRREFVQP